MCVVTECHMCVVKTRDLDVVTECEMSMSHSK